jgi:hypothetical protein
MSGIETDTSPFRDPSDRDYISTQPTSEYEHPDGLSAGKQKKIMY